MILIKDNNLFFVLVLFSIVNRIGLKSIDVYV